MNVDEFCNDSEKSDTSPSALEIHDMPLTFDDTFLKLIKETLIMVYVDV